MKKEQLFDLIQRVSSLSGISVPIIVGSHSLFAVTDNIPAIVLKSIEADFLLAGDDSDARPKISDELGLTSGFYETAGYYADPLGLASVVLIPGWRERLQPLKAETGKTVAICLDPHDAAVSKLIAGREKDWIFINELLASRLISFEVLIERAELIQQTASEGALLPRLQKLFDYLRKQRTITDLKPLSDLISRLP